MTQAVGTYLVGGQNQIGYPIGSQPLAGGVTGDEPSDLAYVAGSKREDQGIVRYFRQRGCVRSGEFAGTWIARAGVTPPWRTIGWVRRPRRSPLRRASRGRRDGADQKGGSAKARFNNASCRWHSASCAGLRPDQIGSPIPGPGDGRRRARRENLARPGWSRAGFVPTSVMSANRTSSLMPCSSPRRESILPVDHDQHQLAAAHRIQDEFQRALQGILHFPDRRNASCW